MANVFMMIFVELDPVAEGLFKCYTHDKNAIECKNLLDSKMMSPPLIMQNNDLHERFCQLPFHSWIWRSKYIPFLNVISYIF